MYTVYLARILAQYYVTIQKITPLHSPDPLWCHQSCFPLFLSYTIRGCKQNICPSNHLIFSIFLNNNFQFKSYTPSSFLYPSLLAHYIKHCCYHHPTDNREIYRCLWAQGLFKIFSSFSFICWVPFFNLILTHFPMETTLHFSDAGTASLLLPILEVKI